jgi:hypothetical protein
LVTAAGTSSGRTCFTSLSAVKTAMALDDIGSIAGMLHQLASTVTMDAAGYVQAVPLADRSLVVAL